MEVTVERQRLPARAARKASGLSMRQICKATGYHPQYVRQIEREGAPYHVAVRLARLYDCDMKVFLPPTGMAGRGRPASRTAIRGDSPTVREGGR